jgi:hypothetical protein
MITQDEINIINSNIKQYLYVIEWLDENENVLDEITVDIVSGNANFDGTKSNRRSINLTLKNLDKKYLPSSQNKLWINKKFRLKCGYLYGGNQKLLYDQGVFLLGNPSILSSPLRKEITIQGLDKWVLFDGTIGGKLKNKTIIPVGTRVDEAIKLLIYNLGGENKYIIDTCDILLPYTIEKEAGTTIAEILEEIANIVSYECFYDNYGWFRFRKYLNPTDYNATPSSWTYTTNGLYLESTRDLNWNEVKNSIKVIGATLNDGTIISAIAQDNSNGDLSISKIGERFELIIDENIFTNQLAQDRANWELQQRIMINENIKATIIPNFSHQVGDIISITDENNGSNGNYVIQTIDFNFSFDSTMNLGLWAIRQWS